MRTQLVVILMMLFPVPCMLAQSGSRYVPPQVNLDSLFVHSEQYVMMGPEVMVFPEMHKKTRSEQRRFDRLTLYFLKVYPYAKLISETIDDIESDLDQFPDDRLKKQYIRYREKQLREGFEDDIRHLTISQGIMLIRLIDRETGDTSYDILKEFKGGFLAGLYQGVARLFGHNLKQEYDPEGEDRELEILVKLYENGQL
ncbi:MAG: DUF4294 domain-containing protein [Candidatus Delongbacteria bacterium]|jgi:hypothetical protein|nr:DUF4294 domain-containing protein [Candidatus Delongbacteria bacterium]